MDHDRLAVLAKAQLARSRRVQIKFSTLNRHD
jgi:hypothetical protein